MHKYVRYHGEMSRRYYGNSGGGGFRGNLRPLRCILPADSLLLSQNDSYGIKNTVKRKCRNYSKDEKSCNDFFRCNIDFELSSSKSLGGSNKYDNPYDLRDLTALSNFKPMPSAITAAPLLEQNTNPPVRHHTNRLVPSHNKNTNPKHTQQKTNNSGDGGDSKPATHIKTQPASQKVDTDYKPEQESRNYFSGNEFTSNPFDGVIQQNQHNPGMDVMYAGHRFERNRHYYASQSSHHPNESSGNIDLVFARILTNFILSSFDFNRMAAFHAGQQLRLLSDTITQQQCEFDPGTATRFVAAAVSSLLRGHAQLRHSRI